jgi:hypothetical protein
MMFCAFVLGVDFCIECEEIVRCAAYFGNARKHTLFIFVVPNCTRRLPASYGDRQSISTLIVVFLPALSPRQIADLVYLFWRMGRTNIFGASGSLLTEIDQKGALSLLSNIKPTILSAVVERMRDIASADLASNAGEDDNNSPVQPEDDELKRDSSINGHKTEGDIKNEVEFGDEFNDEKTLATRRAKRRSPSMSSEEDFGPVDDDPSEDYTPNRTRVRVKLSRRRPSAVKRKRQKRPSQRDDDALVDIVDLPPGMIDEDGIVCKTEIVDTEYDQQDVMAAVASDDGAVDLSEQYTIIQQWEPDAMGHSDDEGDDDVDDVGDQADENEDAALAQNKLEGDHSSNTGYTNSSAV